MAEPPLDMSSEKLTFTIVADDSCKLNIKPKALSFIASEKIEFWTYICELYDANKFVCIFETSNLFALNEDSLSFINCKGVT